MCAALQLPCHPLSSFTDITAEVKLKDAVFCPQSNSLLCYKVHSFFWIASLPFVFPLESTRMFHNTDSLAVQRYICFLKTLNILPLEREELLVTQPKWGKAARITFDWVHSLYLETYWDVSALLGFHPVCLTAFWSGITQCFYLYNISRGIANAFVTFNSHVLSSLFQI